MASSGRTRPNGPLAAAAPSDRAPNLGSTERLNSSDVNRMLMEFLIYFWRSVLVFYPVYLSGYLGLSVSWVLLCMVMMTWWQRNRRLKNSRIGTAIDFVDQENLVISTELKGALQMASWVHLADVEKVNWVNKVLEQAWPFFGMYMEKLLKENIQPIIRQSNIALKMFSFTKIHFGHIPPRITGIKAFTHEVDHREVILDLDICYDGDVDIDADLQPPLTAGVKGLKLQGMIRVILEPLIGQAPLVGGVTFFFIRRPTLQINWTGMTNLLDSPGFSSLSEDTIMDIIASLMVLPNRMCIPLIDQVKVDQMRFPLPRGIVRVHLLEARDLVAKDTYMLGMVKGKSDPYVRVRVGNKRVKSKTVKENLHPKWGEVYEFVVHEAPGQELEVELYDEDTDKDDFLGRYNLDLGEVKREKEIDQWFPLEGVPYGEVHLLLQWLSLQTDASLLKESNNGLACAMLSVYLDSASNLPKDHNEISEHAKHPKDSKDSRLARRVAHPSSYVEFSVGEDVQKSKVVFSSKDPAWEEGFSFFVRNVRTEQLSLQVKEHEKKTQLGVLHLPLSRLLATSNMSLDQRFQLERSGANSQIKLKAVLRILAVEEPPPKIILTPPPKQREPGPGSSAPITPSSSVPAASSPTQTPGPQNGSGEEYLPQRRGSFLAAQTSTSPSSAPSNMRRYDSHSLLSENSLGSSRFDLLEGAPYPEAIRNHEGSFGEIQLTVRYATLRKKLIVQVTACRNLFPCSENGSDSYVRLYLLPDQTWINRKRTQVKRRTVNPVFNHKFEYDVSLEDATTRKLDVAVKNNRMFHRREKKDIGMVLVDLSEMDLIKGVTDWYELSLPGLKKSV
ncbi:extended synaptotagmin-3 [Gouania willdenowi]|uniref:Extended synaptotagmin-3 n=1 Tax=Gouania willdenowi TaxID=441366 RepID=A0A8C5H700_GOUWI|nr:extended synaptotagmin-3 [Gouania willdenowi]